eukprot:scaffold8642_cov105-Cylindrotheca_fusiformis.AAC.3
MTVICRRISGFVPSSVSHWHPVRWNSFSKAMTNDPSSMVGGLLSSVISRANSTLEQRPSNEEPRTKHGPLRYKANPALSNIALAHTLWQSVLRPNVDSAIDATCGNGHDSCALARILFDSYEVSSQSQLVCIDIQEQACANTTRALREELGDDGILENHVQVLTTSHSPLPQIGGRNGRDLGLVVYNLGWLPNSDKDCITKVDSTLESIADGILQVRIGGMISVMTYPKTNPEEDAAVRLFLECVALLSSNIQTWRQFLDSEDNAEMASLSDETKQNLIGTMERVVESGDAKQTWRVCENRKLGMNLAPILLTATRIK